MKDDRKYLLHILECIGRIEEDVSAGRAAFDAAHIIQDGRKAPIFARGNADPI